MRAAAQPWRLPLVGHVRMRQPTHMCFAPHRAPRHTHARAHICTNARTHAHMHKRTHARTHAPTPKCCQLLACGSARKSGAYASRRALRFEPKMHKRGPAACDGSNAWQERAAFGFVLGGADPGPRMSRAFATSRALFSRFAVLYRQCGVYSTTSTLDSTVPSTVQYPRLLVTW